MSRSLVARAAVAVVALAALAGCGSTVHSQGALDATGGIKVLGGTSGSGTNPIGTPTTLPGTTTGGAGSTGGTSTGATSSTGALGGTSGSTPTGGTPGLPSSRGVSATQIRIGITYVKGADQALSAIGAGAISIGDTKAIYDRMVTYINSTGGIAGRKIVPVYFAFDANADGPTQYQAACAKFTQDDHVFAATGVGVATGPAGDTLTPCLAKAGAIWLATVKNTTRDSGGATSIFSPDAISADLELASLVRSAGAHGFLGKGAKVGLIRVLHPEITAAVNDGFRPALAEFGLKLADEVAVSDGNGFPAAVSSAVLRFRTAGVTPVFFAAPGGGGPTYFMTTSEQQGYHPHYSLSSWDFPSVVEQLAPKAQLTNTIGIGYLPVADVRASEDPGGTSATTSCVKIYKDAGFSTTNRLTVGQMLAACDSLGFARQVLVGATTVTDKVFEAAVDAIGARFVPAGTFTTSFRAGSHDGAGSYRNLGFGGSCGCFHYTSGSVSFR